MRINKERVYTIYCDYCNQSESVFTADGSYQETDTPTRYFKRQGWQFKNYKNLCPSCSKLKMQ